MLKGEVRELVFSLTAKTHHDIALSKEGDCFDGVGLVVGGSVMEEVSVEFDSVWKRCVAVKVSGSIDSQYAVSAPLDGKYCVVLDNALRIAMQP